MMQIMTDDEVDAYQFGMEPCGCCRKDGSKFKESHKAAVRRMDFLARTIEENGDFFAGQLREKDERIAELEKLATRDDLQADS